MKKLINTINKRIMSRTMMIAIMGLTTSMQLNAQSVNDVFMALPDSILPYLQQTQRKDLIALKIIEPSAPSRLKNMFRHDVTLAEMKEDYLLLNIDSVKLELQRLPAEGNDSVYCMLLTTQLPQRETTCKIFNSMAVLQYDIPFSAESLIYRPKDMKQSEYEELVKLIDFPIIEANIDKDDHQSILLKLNVSNISKEDKDRIKNILLQKKVKWNGKTFN